MIQIMGFLLTFCKLIKKIVEDGQRNGTFSQEVNPDTLVNMHMGSMRSIIIKWLNMKFACNIEEEMRLMLKGLFKILKQ